MKYFYYVFTIFLYIPLVTLAQSAPATQPGDSTGAAQPGANGVGIPNPLGNITITELFVKILNVVLIFAVPLVAFFIIYAGFLYVTARGNETTITKAHNALLYAVIGGVLILGAGVLITVIQGTVDAIR